MQHLLETAAIRVFIDSSWPHKFWGCHRRSDRSFFVQGRQFHLCARCTGLAAGVPCSLLLLPLQGISPFLFASFATMLIIDGVTQLAGLRESTNGIRFFTGFGAAATLLPSLFAMVRYF